VLARQGSQKAFLHKIIGVRTVPRQLEGVTAEHGNMLYDIGGQGFTHIQASPCPRFVEADCRNVRNSIYSIHAFRWLESARIRAVMYFLDIQKVWNNDFMMCVVLDRIR
jgi:hypothetical protein